MKKSLLLLLISGTITSSNAQGVIFQDSFESYSNFAISNVGDWTLRDVDQATGNYAIQNYTFPNQEIIPSFIVFNPSLVTPLPSASGPFLNAVSQARTGQKYMAAFASYNINSSYQTVAVTQSDWLISPQITLGNIENKVVFWAKSYSIQYGAERFRVLISSTNTEVASFTTSLSTGNYVSANSTDWTEYSYDIPASFNSQSVHIAIQCVSDDAFFFMVDDFKVTTEDPLNNNQFFKENFTIFPNPTTEVLNITSINGLEFQEVSIIDLTGRKVMSVRNTSAIDVSDLASGTYIIQIQALEGKATSKFIKK